MTTVAQSEPKCVIYGAWCVCHPGRGIYYVGQTLKGMNSRWYHHLWLSRREDSRSFNSRFSRWIRKHDERNICFSILEVCTPEDIDDSEIRWILYLRSQGQAQGNLLAGGSQPRGHKRPEHSARMTGAGNPMYGVDRAEIMAHARSFQGAASEETRRKMGESRRGSKNGRAKLTEDDVKEIRSRYSGKWPYGSKTRIAKEFGVSVQMIGDIVNRKNWKHVE